jgi:ABC-type multidrug transport system ATPase subunit
MSRDDIDRATPALLDRLGLEEVSNRRVGTFSKGMTQRLGLAQALLHDPDLLILDEPTSGLDPQGRRLVLDIIREEKDKGRTIFLSSHILSDVERTCDEVVMLMKGEVAFTERIEDKARPSSEWEIDVEGWTPGSRALLAGHDVTIESEMAGRATIVCGAPAKKALLHALTATDLDVGSVRPRRAGTLEEKYMLHAGKG